jgi:3-oxoacyl-[acyl-carrier-protein] synthase-1
MCDLNGERSRTEEFTASIVDLWEAFDDRQRLVTPCVHLGDVGAASGPLFLGLAACSMVAEPTEVKETLITTMSQTGNSCAVLLEVPTDVNQTG